MELTVTKMVLGVGNCSFDQGAIEELISAHFDAKLAAASLPDEALEMLRRERFDLVLINRKLLADSSQGVKLIERIKSDPELAETRVMLLSNYSWAQRAAAAAGAEPGFGKAQLDRPDTLDKLARLLGG